MAIKTLEHNGLTWVNVDQVDAEALHYLRTTYAFHPLDLEDVETEQQTPKMDVYKDYLFLVLQVPGWDAADKTIVLQEIDFFIGERYVIVIQSTKSKELKNFFSRCIGAKQVKEDWMSKGSGYLLYQILEALFHTTRPILNHFGKNLSDLEQKIFSGNQQSGAILELGMNRRNVLSFRRMLDPERQLMMSLNNALPDFLLPHNEPISLHNYFDNINDYLNNLWAVINTYRDTIDGLHVTVESLLNRRINKIISTLTVISVGLLPLNLLSGIYGMNIDGLPFAREPEWVWLMFGALSLLILGIIFFMKRQKWL